MVDTQMQDIDVAVASQTDLESAARDIAAAVIRAIGEDLREPQPTTRSWAFLAARRARPMRQSWKKVIEDAVLQVMKAGNEAVAVVAARAEQCELALAREQERAAGLAAQIDRLGRTTADDLRAAGLTLAHHSDTLHPGHLRTSWLFVTADGRALRGEAETDADALDLIRAQRAQYDAAAAEPASAETGEASAS